MCDSSALYHYGLAWLLNCIVHEPHYSSLHQRDLLMRVSNSCFQLGSDRELGVAHPSSSAAVARAFHASTCVMVRKTAMMTRWLLTRQFVVVRGWGWNFWYSLSLGCSCWCGILSSIGCLISVNAQ